MASSGCQSPRPPTPTTHPLLPLGRSLPQVVVTAVTTNSDGATVVSYVVTGLDDEDLSAVSDAVESGPFAEQLTEAVSEVPGLEEVEAQPAQAEEQTVQVRDGTRSPNPPLPPSPPNYTRSLPSP